MSDNAKIFKSGGSQAVRLPKEYRLENQERVRIYRQGGRVILESERPTWSQEFLSSPAPNQIFPILTSRLKPSRVPIWTE